MSKIQTSLRIEEETLSEAKEILASLGMNFTEAVNIFTAMVVQERGLPFDVKISDYPSVSFEGAREKVKKSLKNITPENGVASDEFFSKMMKKSSAIPSS